MKDTNVSLKLSPAALATKLSTSKRKVCCSFFLFKSQRFRNRCAHWRPYGDMRGPTLDSCAKARVKAWQASKPFCRRTSLYLVSKVLTSGATPWSKFMLRTHCAVASSAKNTEACWYSRLPASVSGKVILIKLSKGQAWNNAMTGTELSAKHLRFRCFRTATAKCSALASSKPLLKKMSIKIRSRRGVKPQCRCLCLPSLRCAARSCCWHWTASIGEGGQAKARKKQFWYPTQQLACFTSQHFLFICLAWLLLGVTVLDPCPTICQKRRHQIAWLSAKCRKKAGSQNSNNCAEEVKFPPHTPELWRCVSSWGWNLDLLQALYPVYTRLSEYGQML